MTGEDGRRGSTADTGASSAADEGSMPGLVVEPETLPDGRSITYFSAGDGAQRSSTRTSAEVGR